MHPLVFVCGRPRDIPAPPGQPTTSCVRIDSGCLPSNVCGPFPLTIYTTTAGKYALWLETSDTEGVWGPPLGDPSR